MNVHNKLIIDSLPLKNVIDFTKFTSQLNLHFVHGQIL